MFDVPERDIQYKNVHYDGEFAFKIMQKAGLAEQDGQYNCKQLGAPESSRIRPLKVLRYNSAPDLLLSSYWSSLTV